MGKRIKLKHPGAIVLLWVFIASIIAICIYVKFGGTGKSTVGGFIIAALFGLLLYPVVKYLQNDLLLEQEKLVLKKLNRLIAQGKYEKAKKYLSRNQFRIHDEHRLIELKKQLGLETGLF